MTQAQTAPLSSRQATSSSPVSTKRPRLISPVPSRFKACENCYKAKSKCEEVDTVGCHRCRSRHLDCSLFGVGVSYDSHRFTSLSDSTNTTSTPQSTVLEINRRLESIETAITAIQSAIHGSHKAPSAVPSQAQVSAQLPASVPIVIAAIPKRYPDFHAFQRARQKNLGAVTWGETLTSCWTDPDMYPDVVARGLISRSQVDLAFPIFKHRFATIMPLSRYALTTTSPPNHPALVIAMLAFVPEVAPPNLGDLIDETVLYSLTGAVNIDIVHALFLLSLAPYSQSTFTQTPPTPLRLISLAHQYGQDLGCEKQFEVSCRAHDLDESQWDSLLLWEAITTHFNILHVCFTRRASLTYRQPRPISDAPNDPIKQSLSHLIARNSLMQSCSQVIDRLSEWEVLIHQGWLDVEDAVNLFTEFSDRLDVMRRDLNHKQTMLDATFLELAVYLRLRLLFLFPPTPNNPDTVVYGQSITGILFIQSCERAIRAFLTHPPTNMASCPYTPAYTYFGIIAACATLRQARTESSINSLDSSDSFAPDELHRAEAFLACHQGLPGFVYRHMWKSIQGEALPDLPPPLPTSENGEVDWEAVFKDCNLDDLLASFQNS